MQTIYVNTPTLAASGGGRRVPTAASAARPSPGGSRRAASACRRSPGGSRRAGMREAPVPLGASAPRRACVAHRSPPEGFVEHLCPSGRSTYALRRASECGNWRISDAHREWFVQEVENVAGKGSLTLRRAKTLRDQGRTLGLRTALTGTKRSSSAIRGLAFERHFRNRPNGQFGGRRFIAKRQK